MNGMEVLQKDAAILEGLLKKTYPAVYRHLQKHKVEPLLYMTDWFLCAMTRTLPWESLLRVWDCFLAEGIRVIFKVALVILGGTLDRSKVRKRCSGLCETLEALRNPPEQILDEEYLINQMQRLNLRVEDFYSEHARQSAKRAKLRSFSGQATSGSQNPLQDGRSNSTTATNPSNRSTWSNRPTEEGSNTDTSNNIEKRATASNHS